MSREVPRAMAVAYAVILIATLLAFGRSGAGGLVLVLVFLNLVVLSTMLLVGRRARRRAVDATAQTPPPPEDAP